MSCILVHKQSPSLNAPKIYIIICEFICIINIFHFIWYFQHHCAAIETTHKLEFLVFKLIHLFRCSGQCKNSKLSRAAEMIAHTHADMHAETLTCRTIKQKLKLKNVQKKKKKLYTRRPSVFFMRYPHLFFSVLFLLFLNDLYSDQFIKH